MSLKAVYLLSCVRKHFTLTMAMFEKIFTLSKKSAKATKISELCSVCYVTIPKTGDKPLKRIWPIVTSSEKPSSQDDLSAANIPDS